MNKEKGITLIALVITIVITLILAGVTISMLFGENGILNNANEATFKTEFKAYQEQVNTYTTGARIGVNVETMLNDVNNINAGADAPEPKLNIYTIIKNLKKENEPKVEVAKGEMYYVPRNVKSNQTKLEVKWCFEVNIKVKGYNSYEDFLEGVEGIEVPDGSYMEVGGVYSNSPDLTGFNYKNTYYVSWDSSGKETIGETINKEPPQNWYNYKKKEWANVVTINGDKMSYFVWIPRYAYKIENDIQNVDVKFVDKANIHKDFETNKTTKYNDKTPIYNDDGKQANYIVPEEFVWDMTEPGGEGEKRELAGYWVSKYEVSTADTGIDYNLKIDKNKISIEKMGSKNISATLNYEIYLDGKEDFKGANITFPYDFNNLATNSEHTIKIIAKDQGGNIFSINEMKTKTLEDDIKNVTTPDLTGFNKEKTFYVTYDESGKETTTPITQAPPPEWYDYVQKKWANIVTINEEKISYFVWIPRYEYKTKPILQEVEIRFIKPSQTTPTEGYIIPDEFRWNMEDSGQGIKELAGYWVSKYEVSTADTGIDYNIIIDKNKLVLAKMGSKNISATLNYDIYFDDREIQKGANTFPYEFNNLATNSEHTIKIIARDPEGRVIAINTMKTKTLEEDIQTITKPDLTGFNKEKTFYVTYDNAGNENTNTPISQAPPAGWYDYTQKKWANIVTKNGEKMAYFVWIPRYEYKTKPILQEIEIRFIKPSQTSPTEGYIVPDEFRWNMEDSGEGIKELTGYWVSKYEVSS